MQKSSSAGGGKKKTGPTQTTYTPEQRAAYRAYYQNRQKQRAAASVSSGAQKRSTTAGQGSAAKAGGKTAVWRASAPARRKKTSGGGGSFRLPNSTLRMLLVAAAAVLLMFGLIRLIGRAGSDRKEDYIPPMRTEDYLASLATPEPDPTEAPLPTDAPATEPDPGTEEQPAEQPPEAYPTAEPEPTSAPTPEEGYFPEAEDEPEATAAPTQAPASSGGLRTATLRFAGDVVVDKEMLTTAYNSKTGKYSFKNFFNLARDILSNADLTAINVDGSMGGEKYYKYGYSGYPQFNTPPTLMYALQGAGVDMLTLANNHALDGWWEGFKQTIVNADYVGLFHIGGFRTQEEHDTPEIIEVNGIRVGFLNYTQSFNSMDTRGVDKAALQYGLRSTRNADYEGDIKALRSAGAEVVVVVMHWGKEYLLSPDDNQKTMAKQIVAAGADVIVGGHPHTAQVGGWMSATTASGETNQCLIIYSLGNFLTNHRNEDMARTDWGVVLEFTLQENAETGKIDVIAPKYIPVGVWRIGSPGAYDWRVVGVDSVLANRPAGMSDSAYERFVEISSEADSVYAKSGFVRIGN